MIVVLGINQTGDDVDTHSILRSLQNTRMMWTLTVPRSLQNTRMMWTLTVP